MRLTELNPIWVSFGGNNRKTGFAFDCPCCRKVKLLCKAVPADYDEQERIIQSTGIGEDDIWVPARADAVWHWDYEDFNQMTVNPSIDASAGGHWHGHIKGGEIVP